MAREQSIHGGWAGRWTFIMAATGSAVGLGNIWKFPYITGEHGGGAFVLVYLVCIALVGIPIMIAEVALGRRGRQSPINSMMTLAKESGASKLWSAIGWMGALSGFLILSFYAVIAGWALYYFVEAVQGTFANAGTKQVSAVFDGLLASPGQLIFWTSVFMVLTISVIAGGVNKGLERTIRILMPLLFVLLVILLGFSMSSGNFADGFAFLFDFNFEKALSGKAVLVALGHSFFTLSLGMGAIMVYGAYMPKEASIGKTVITVAILDTIVALVAGLVIFPIVFANSLDPGAGPGLMFVTLPVAFGHMPGGVFFCALFFLLVTFAAWSSAISLAEPAVAWLVEQRGMGRAPAAIGFGAVAWVLSLGTVFSFNYASEWKLFGKTFFDNLDFLTANIMLPLGGLLMALFVGWAMKEKEFKEEISASEGMLWTLFSVLIRFVAPVLVVLVFLNAIGLI